jgi:hypothetical protein
MTAGPATGTMMAERPWKTRRDPEGAPHQPAAAGSHRLAPQLIHTTITRVQT